MSLKKREWSKLLLNIKKKEGPLIIKGLKGTLRDHLVQTLKPNTLITDHGLLVAGFLIRIPPAFHHQIMTTCALVRETAGFLTGILTPGKKNEKFFFALD